MTTDAPIRGHLPASFTGKAVSSLKRLAGLSVLSLLLWSMPALSAAAGSAPKDTVPSEKSLSDEEAAQSVERLRNEYSLFSSDARLRGRLAAAHALVGRRQLDRRQFDEAEKSFSHACELEPDHPGYRLGRGTALYGEKRYDDALFELEQARLFGGDSALVLYLIGRIHYDTGDLEGALEAWRKALALEPANAELVALVDKTGREALSEAAMGKETSSRFTITYDVSTESRLADEILDILESAYNQIGSDFGHYPETRTPVILYTRQEFRQTTTGPDWSGGIYDGKIRLPIGGVKKITARIRGVLFHEYTHVVVRELTKGNCPTWLNEGLAVFEERKEFRPQERKDVRGELLPRSVLEGSFLSLGTKEAALAYQQSYAMVDYLVSVYGLHKIREILLNLGKGLKVQDAVTQAFADYGLDYATVLSEAREHIAHE